MFFYGHSTCEGFNVDHKSDHIEGVLLFLGAFQSCCAFLTYFDNSYILNQHGVDIKYTTYVENRDFLIYVRAEGNKIYFALGQNKKINSYGHCLFLKEKM
jgi:hypothetical protein